MSSKFSRRSTRVQHTPHVCESNPPVIPPFVPNTMRIIAAWSWTDGFFSSDFSGHVDLELSGITGFWQGAGTDDQGHAFDVTVNIPPAPTMINGGFVVTLDPTPPFPQVLSITCDPVTGDPGTRPWTSSTASLDVLFFGSIGSYNLASP